MNRRQFVKTLSLGTLATRLPANAFAGSAPQIAITMDDPNLEQTPRLSPVERNAKILAAFRTHKDLRAALFVCGKRVDSVAGKQLLQNWNDAGHQLGNHTYSHNYYHSSKIDFANFVDDTLRCETIIKDFSRFTKLFRYPFLKEGDTVEKRDQMRAFLKERGYRMGYVTIDASDWYVDQRLNERLKKDANAAITAYRDFYLQHIWERATFYNDLALQVLQRPVKHTLLIHHSLLNALFLPDLLKMFENKGWKLLNADEAFKDAVFSAAPNILPAGESIIWALAKETKRFDKRLRYPGEDGEYEKAAMDKLGL
jgi:peptidoglycan/xylan/chitin deacetylase (PgdA/CDA1 family)